MAAHREVLGILQRAVSGQVYADEPMARHTSYRIGGPADYLVVCESQADLADTLSICTMEGLDYFVCGKGSNLLVSDAGYRGLVITLGSAFRKVSFNEDRDGASTVEVGAAAFLTALAQKCARRGLSGLEFAVGIPGTVGGALRMNAGAHGQTIGEVTRQVCVVDHMGLIKTYGRHALDFGYRRSGLKSGEIIVSALFSLPYGIHEQVQERMDQAFKWRQQAQPLNKPSCGSVFKNGTKDGHPYSAAALIDQAGLKGYQVGGAEVSPKHANFIVNDGGATAADVSAIIEHIQNVVGESFGVILEPEVQFLGFN